MKINQPLTLAGYCELLFIGGTDGQIKVISAKTTEILDSNFPKFQSLESTLSISSQKQTYPDIIGMIYDDVGKRLLLLHSDMTLHYYECDYN
jgi:hypothetical protein